MTEETPKQTALAPSGMKTTPLRQVKSVSELLWNENARVQLAQVAAKHMSPERLMRVVANAIRTTPKLQECDPLSMLGALMQCASLGLEPNTVLGHAYLIPFENKKKGIVQVQLIIGYKGFADLARRSGQIAALHADVVYSDDELWDYEYGSEMRLRHKPGPQKGKKIAAYCHVKLTDGQAFVVLPWDQVLAIRDKSQGWQAAKRFGKTAESPWVTHEDRMGAKTAVRALANRGEMPLSIEFMDAMEVDDERIDYASLAKNPGAGPIVDAESVIIEGEAVAAPAEEEAPPPTPTPATTPETTPTTTPATTPTPTPSAPPSPPPPPSQAPPSTPSPSPSPTKGDGKKNPVSPDPSEPKADSRWEKLYDRVMNDALDAKSVDKALALHAADLEEMLRQDPQMHANLMEELNDWAAAPTDDEDGQGRLM